MGFNFRVGDSVFERNYTIGEQENRSVSSSVYSRLQSSAGAAGVGWKAQGKAETGAEVNQSLSWSWYSSTTTRVKNRVVNESVCYWQERFCAYDGCGGLIGNWAGALENDRLCPNYFEVL